MSYTFVFFGEIQPDFAAQDVQDLLAKKFKVQEDDIKKLFTVGAKFERRGLTQNIAQAYQQVFSEAGAIGHIIEPMKVSARGKRAPLPEEKKEKDIIPDSKTQTETPFSSPKDHSSNWIILGVITIFATMAANYYFQFDSIKSQGIFGLWPLILAHIPLIIGCALKAEMQGRSVLTGAILGALSFPGMVLLLLWPIKKNIAVNNYVIYLTVGVCLLITKALFSTWTRNDAGDEFYLMADTLHEGRSEYPGKIQSSNSVYEREQEEIYDYMKKIVHAYAEETLRPDALKGISKRMYTEFDQYLIWREYQFFKHKEDNVKLPDALKKDFFAHDTTTFRSIVKSIDNLGRSYLKNGYQDWSGANYQVAANSIENKTGATIGRICDSVAYDWYAQTDARLSENKNRKKSDVQKLKMDKLTFPKIDNAKLDVFEQHIEYSFYDGQLNGKRIALGLYQEEVKPSKKFNFISNRKKSPKADETGFSKPKCILIYTDGLPNKYFGSLLSPISKHHYDIDYNPIFDR